MKNEIKTVKFSGTDREIGITVGKLARETAGLLDLNSDYYHSYYIDINNGVPYIDISRGVNGKWTLNSSFVENMYRDFRKYEFLFFNSKEQRNKILEKITNPIKEKFPNLIKSTVCLLIHPEKKNEIFKALKINIKWNDTRKKQDNGINKSKILGDITFLKPYDGSDPEQYVQYVGNEEQQACIKLGIDLNAMSIACMFWDLETGKKARGGTWGRLDNDPTTLSDFTLGKTPYNQDYYPVDSKVQAIVFFNSIEAKENILGGTGYDDYSIRNSVGAIICVPAEQYNPAGLGGKALKQKIKPIVIKQTIKEMRVIDNDSFLDILNKTKKDDSRKIYIVTSWYEDQPLDTDNMTVKDIDSDEAINVLKNDGKRIKVKYDRASHSFLMLYKKGQEAAVW